MERRVNDTDFIIRGLPADIATVPHWPPDLAENGWRDEWRDWAPRISRYRAALLAEALMNPAQALHQRGLCASFPEYFLAMYCWIFEPRDQQLVPEGWNPWIPFPHQVMMLRWLERLMSLPRPAGDGIIEKSRDMGMTWVVMLYCIHQWLFAKSFSAGLISYKEDVVDSPLAKSMFFKLRGLLGVLKGSPPLPDFLFDPLSLGWDDPEHNRKLALIHPDDAAKAIGGEPTTIRSGSGDRVKFRFNDEAAKVEDLREILAGQTAVTMHKVSGSSAYLKFGPDFEAIARLAREDAQEGRLGNSYLRLDTRFHPLHDPEWIERERLGYEKDNNLAGFAREIMGDYQAGETGWIYAAHVEKARTKVRGYHPEEMLYVGLDVGRKDDTAGVWANAVLTDTLPTFHYLGLYERNLVTAKYWSHLFTGIPPALGDEYDGAMGRAEDGVMAFFRTAWSSPGGVEFTGDPAGDQKTAASPQSFYDTFMLFTLELRRRVRKEYAERSEPAPAWAPDGPIVVFFGELHKLNDHDTRRGALRANFNRGASYEDNADGRRLREKHRRYRFQERTREATNDPLPVHDEHTHPVVCTEYMSVWLDILGATRRKEEKKAERALDRSRMRPVGERRAA
mgnify:FL=1